MLGAVYANFLAGEKSYGGSSGQPASPKTRYYQMKKSYLRKFQELSVSIAIEREYSKDEILEMYLNSAFFGGNAFGIEDAAKSFFNKSPKDLTLAESAMIIGVLPRQMRIRRSMEAWSMPESVKPQYCHACSTMV